MVTVHGFKGSGVQGSVFVNSLYFGCVFIARQKTVILPNLNVRPNPKLGAKLVITWGNEHV